MSADSTISCLDATNSENSTAYGMSSNNLLNNLVITINTNTESITNLREANHNMQS
jgi:hypothetical protein